MAATATSKRLTVGQAALRLGAREWQLSSLYRRHLLEEPERLGRFRVIDSDDLPRIREALVQAGYLADPGPSGMESQP